MECDLCSEIKEACINVEATTHIPFGSEEFWEQLKKDYHLVEGMSAMQISQLVGKCCNSSSCHIDLNTLQNKSSHLSAIIDACDKTPPTKPSMYFQACNIQITTENGNRLIVNRGCIDEHDNVCSRVLGISTKYNISIGKVWKLLYGANGNFDTLDKYLIDHKTPIWLRKNDFALANLLHKFTHNEVIERLKKIQQAKENSL
jgi:hypothetical protein